MWTSTRLFHIHWACNCWRVEQITINPGQVVAPLLSADSSLLFQHFSCLETFFPGAMHKIATGSKTFLLHPFQTKMYCISSLTKLSAVQYEHKTDAKDHFNWASDHSVKSLHLTSFLLAGSISYHDSLLRSEIGEIFKLQLLGIWKVRIHFRYKT